MLNAYSTDEIVIAQSQGYAEWKTRLVRNLAGEEMVSTIKLYISKRLLDRQLSQPLTHDDRVKSINGDEIDRAIITIHQPKAFSSPHYEVFLA